MPSLRLDGHVHLSPDGGWFGTRFDASEARLVAELEAAGLDGALLLPTVGLADDRFVAEVCRRHPGVLAGFGMPLADNGQSVRDQVVRALDEYGLRGFKLHPRMQNIDPLGPFADQVLTEAQRRGAPVMFCTMPGASSVPLVDLQPYVYDKLAKRHPEATIILAHAGAHRAMDAFFVAKANANVHLDISFVLSYLAGSSAIQDLIHVIVNLDQRVIFGSDFPEKAIPDYLALLGQAVGHRDDCDLAAVLGGNLARLLKAW